MKYNLFIGRYQVPGLHDGHKKLMQTVLDEGKNVLIAVRNTATDKKNPFDASEIASVIEQQMMEHGDRVKVIIIPDIEEICYGRGVGYGIREIELDAETQAISATEIRNAKNLS